MFDPDVGVANPNAMRDKRILELKAKHNFYVMPTFNKNNLRMYTQKYKNEFDDTLTIYSGGGYIAKSKLGSTYSKRKHGYKTGARRSIHTRGGNNKARRFNEQLDEQSQKSVSRRSVVSRSSHLSRRHTSKRNSLRSAPQQPRKQEPSKEEIKRQILDKIEKMTEEEIDKVSRQLDEISKTGNEEQKKDLENPENEVDKQDTYDKAEEYDQVGDLPSPANFAENKSVSELSECNTKHRDFRSRSSKTSKTYISHLKNELEAEKAERMKLEAEIEELKKVSSEISSRLGLTPHKKL